MNPLTGKKYSKEYWKIKGALAGIPANAPQIADEFRRKLADNDILIVIAETGAGKSVRLPIFAAELLKWRGKIALSQPRVLTTKSIATFLAAQLDVPIGNYVGYLTGDEKEISDKTRLTVMVDAILAETLINEIEKYDIVIVDEVHERNVNIDLILALARKYHKIRDLAEKAGKAPAKPRVKFVLLSATIDKDKYLSYFSGQKVADMFIAGRKFDVAHKYLEDFAADAGIRLGKAPPPFAVAGNLLIKYLLERGAPGDILMFLPTKAAIYGFIRKFSGKYPGVLVGALFRGIPKKIAEFLTHATEFRESGEYNRRLIFATDVAETGITIDGIQHVIESGVSNTLRLYQSSGTRKLSVTWINKYSMIQRCGRAGRTGAGTCYHLYTRRDAAGFSPRDSPEVYRTDLYGLILRVASLAGSVRKATKFMSEEFIDTVSPFIINKYAFGLYKLSFLAGDSVTIFGEFARMLPLPHDLAALIIYSYKYKIQGIMTGIVAMMALSKNPSAFFIKGQAPPADYTTKYGDPGAHIRIFRKIVGHSGDYLEKLCKKAGLNYNILKYLPAQMKAISRAIRRFAGHIGKIPELQHGLRIKRPAALDEIGKMDRVLLCFQQIYPDNIALYSERYKNYTTVSEKARLYQTSPFLLRGKDVPEVIGYAELIFIDNTASATCLFPRIKN